MKPASSPFFGRLDQHRAGAVAEQHAGGAVGVIDDAAHRVGADHQHFLVRAGRHQMRRRGQPVDEIRSRPRSDRIPRRRFAPSAFCTRQAVDGKNMSGVTVHTMMASISDASIPRCASAHFAAAIAMSEVAISGFGDVPLANPGALHDPLIAGVHQLFQVLIGQNSWRSIAPERGDLGLGQCFVLESSG